MTNNLAIEFETFSEFFNLTMFAGAVPAHSVTSLSGYFDSLSLPPGLYTADVSIAHTGAGISPLALTANLTVADQPGAVTIISPTQGATILQGNMVWIEATATDPDGLERVKFYDGATKIGETYSYPGTGYHYFHWYVNVNGSRSLTAKAIDMFGGVSASSAVVINVGANADYDGMPDSWEIANYLNPNDPDDADIDADTDGYSNLEEYRFGTNPQYPEDTDFDGMPDGWEYHNGTDINTADDSVDADGDGLTNLEEYWYGTNPLSFDTDSDQLPDLYEIENWLDPLTFTANEDPDLDGLTNLDEFLNQTDPNNADTDGEGKTDGEEVAQGSDPKNAADGGNPPPDPLENVEFLVGGDYASWRMEIKSLGPRDTRTLLVVSPAPGTWETKNHKLWKNNKYEITMHHTGSRPQDDPPWYCWEGQIDGKPGVGTFPKVGDYQLGARNAEGKYFVIKNHWIVDNADGLLTSHLHSKGVNHVTGKKAILRPVELKDISNNKVITDIAWIKGHKTDGSDEEPEMPKLEARVIGLPDTVQVLWKLQSRYPRRNGRDDLNVPYTGGDDPGVFTIGDQPGKIWEDIDFSTDPIFGGNETLIFKLIGANGALGEGVVEFKIRGENPDDARCKAYITTNQGNIWYAWAVAKHESKQGNMLYNQFNSGGDGPAFKNEPNLDTTADGWGLFQRDSSSGYQVTTAETWSWTENMEGFLHTEYTEHLGYANAYVDSVQQANPQKFEEPEFVIKGNTISGRHVLALTRYNGAQGRSKERLLHFDPSKQSGHRWTKDLPDAPGDHPAGTTYVDLIMSEYNGG